VSERRPRTAALTAHSWRGGSLDYLVSFPIHYDALHPITTKIITVMTTTFAIKIRLDRTHVGWRMYCLETVAAEIAPASIAIGMPKNSHASANASQASPLENDGPRDTTMSKDAIAANRATAMPYAIRPIHE